MGRLKLLFPGLAEVREEGLGDSFRMAAPLPALELAGRSRQSRRVMGSLPEYAPQVERLERAGRWERGRLTRGAVDRLYGQRVPMSASRMDKYKSCHFSYFMRYGLQAEPRKPAGFTAPEYGTFVHYVLEHVLDAVSRGDGREVKELTDEAVTKYVTEELGGMVGETPRFRYLFERLKNTVAFVVENAVEELSVSQFRPLAFELGFGSGKELPAIEVRKDGLTVSVTRPCGPGGRLGAQREALSARGGL